MGCIGRRKMPCSALCAYAQLRCWAMRASCVLASCALIGWAEIPSILPRHITGVQGWARYGRDTAPQVVDLLNIS